MRESSATPFNIALMQVIISIIDRALQDGLDFVAAAVVFAIAYLGGQFILLIANLINHDRCDLASPFNLARTFDSRWENWLFLNHGFHAVHHRRTTLHWSALRQVHDDHFRDRTDPDLQSRSFLAYFFRHYVIG